MLRCRSLLAHGTYSELLCCAVGHLAHMSLCLLPPLPWFFFFLPRVESNEENQPPFSVRENDMYLETSAESQLPSHVPI